MKLTKQTTRLSTFVMLAFSAAVTARADYQSTVLSQSPAAYYRLNETVQPMPNGGATNSGSLGSGGNGNFIGLPALNSPGPFAGSVSIGLDGTAQYISTPSNAGLNTPAFTFEIWLNPAQAPKFAYVAGDIETTSPRTGWYLAQDDGSTFSLGSAWVVRMFNTNTTTQSITLSAPVTAAGTWVHLALTYDGTTAVLYTNGVVASSGIPTGNPVSGIKYVPNSTRPFTVGCRSDIAFPWPGLVAETAMYPSAISATRIAAHFTAGMTTPGSYASTVLADAPLLYHRYQAPANSSAANLGTLGSAGNGKFLLGSQAAAPGPMPPVYPGFVATNVAAAFDGLGGAVELPAFNFNTNTITISAWVNATNIQKKGAGIVVCDSGTTAAGLIIDGVNGGYGLGYYWNNQANTYTWSPSDDAGLPALPDSDWAYVALVIQPTEANMYIATTNGGVVSFSGVTNKNSTLTHPNQAFATSTLVGTDAGDPVFSFNGAVDEVAIWKRALSSGELYTQFASAVGGLEAIILADLLGPTEPVAVGDPIVLSLNAGGTPPLIYTWYKEGVAIATTTNNGTFTIASAILADTGNYDVTVTNGLGTASSQQVPVTVVNPSQPIIVSKQGFNNRTLYPTGTLHVAVSAVGGGLKYQWYKNGTAIPSATDSSYHISRVTAANAGSYSVSVTNSVGIASNGPVVITIPSVSPGTFEAAIVASSPEAWWRLGESAGSTNMFDGMGRHDGVYTNINGVGSLPTLGVAGALITNANTAASFNASGGIGIAPFSEQLNTSPFTVEIWVKTTVTTGGQVPVSSSDANGGWGWMNNAGYWNGYSPAANAVAPLDDYPYGAEVIPGVWTHLVISYDETIIGSDGEMYPYEYWINGQNPGYIWQGDPANSTGSFIIGGSGTGLPTSIANRLFNGQIDEVIVYPRGLSTTEIQAHYAARGVEYIAPTFTSTPLSQTVVAGKSIAFSATVVGAPTPLVYQWYKNGTPIGGATTNSYNIASAALADSGTYTLSVTNLAGSNAVSATFTVVSPTGYANVTNDLVLHLRFDGDANDSSGHGNNGAPSSSPAPGFVSGVVGSQAAEFTTTTILAGTNTVVDTTSYVGLGTPSDLLFGSSTSFSVSLWAKLPVSTEPGDVPFVGTEINAANNPGWFVGPSYQNGGWQWNLNDGTNNIGVSGDANSINNGNWHNLIVTVNRASSVVSSYLDGVLISTRSIIGLGSINVGGAVTIGQDPTHTYAEESSYALDDIGIWRRALTPLEVASLESAGTSGRSFDTVGPAAVTLTISSVGGNLLVQYPSGTLLQSDTVGAGAVWTPVPGASAPSYTTSPTNAAKFYRVLVQ